MLRIPVAVLVVGVFLVIALFGVAFKIWKYFWKVKKGELSEATIEEKADSEVYEETIIKIMTDPQLDIREMRQQIESENELRNMYDKSTTHSQLSSQRSEPYGQIRSDRNSRYIEGRRKSDVLGLSLPENLHTACIQDVYFDINTQRSRSEDNLEETVNEQRKFRRIDLRRVTEDMLQEIPRKNATDTHENLPLIQESSENEQSSSSATTPKAQKRNRNLPGSVSLLKEKQFPWSFLEKQFSGQITLRIKINLLKSSLEIQLIRAFELKTTDGSSGPIIYIKISMAYGKFKKQKTKIVKGTLAPFFNETFVFTGLRNDEYVEETLVMKVLNQRTVLPEMLGKLTLPLSRVDLIHGEEFTLEIYK